MGFTKLDEGIVHSSIWSESYPTRVLWVTMLAMCDSKGFVSSSRQGLIRAANITEVEFGVSIAILEAPDLDSRSPEFDGRRVEKRDGGWQVLNYAKYRNFSYSSSPEAVRQRKHRDKTRPCDGSLHVTKRRDISASASASKSSLNNKEKDAAAFDSWWSRYPRKVAKKVAAKAYAQAIKAGATPEDLARAVEGYRYELRRNGTEERYCLHPSTFLHDERWRDYLNIEPVHDIGSNADPRYHKAEGKKGEE